MSPVTSLTEELAVLAYRPDTHKRQSSPDPSDSLEVALAASLIIELIESGRIALERQQEKEAATNTYALRVLSAQTTGNPAQDALLDRVADPRHAGRALSWWIYDGDALRATVDQLVAKKLMVERYKQFGPIWYDYRFEPIAREWDTALRERFHEVFVGGQEPTDREVLMAAIIYYGNVWPYFGPRTGSAERHAFHLRMEELARRRRPPVAEVLTVPDDDVAAVLDALIIARSGSGQ
jgi:hypothetical protein